MIHATDKTSAIHQSTIWGLHHHARHRFVQAVLHFQCRKYQRDTDQLVPHGSYSKNSSLVPQHLLNRRSDASISEHRPVYTAVVTRTHERA